MVMFNYDILAIRSHRPTLMHMYVRLLHVFAVTDVTAQIEAVQNYSAKARRVLKGHQGKVLCMDWCMDKRHIVSSSQVLRPRQILKL